jgi:hypothetical protein
MTENSPGFFWTAMTLVFIAHIYLGRYQLRLEAEKREQRRKYKIGLLYGREAECWPI